MDGTRLSRMVCQAASLWFLLFNAVPAQAGNTDPIILVHGFAGFGQIEVPLVGHGKLVPLRYWGGLTDLREIAPDTMKTAVVGPFSANWDRAVELFYQIKGGCIDYGKAHADAINASQAHRYVQVPSAEPGAVRARTCFDQPLYAEWDAAHPIHLVGHSMGGQTARMLVQLLADNDKPGTLGYQLFSSQTNNAADRRYKVSAGWVKSVTTISTPNDGTTLADLIGDKQAPIEGLALGLAAIAGAGGDAGLLDFKLDQWGLQPKTDTEKLVTYIAGVMASPLWHDLLRNKNFGPYDESPAGAAEANAWVRDQPSVYYFSLTTRTTYDFLGSQAPLGSTTFPLKLLAGPAKMGRFEPDASDSASHPFPPVRPVKSWWPNDGIVPTISQRAPNWAMDAAGRYYPRCVDPKQTDASLLATDCTNINDIGKRQAPRAGMWNSMPAPVAADHFQIVGLYLPLLTPDQKQWQILRQWYTDHVTLLHSL